jgi:hypothetical protein
MCENQRCKVSSIQIGESQEIMIEELLMKLSMVQDILRLYGMAEDDAATRDERAEPLDDWTWGAIHKNIADVSHALKCACWGHEGAYLR